MHLQLSPDTLTSLWPMLGDAAVKSAVLMLTASAAALAMRKAPAARRHLVWVLALAGSLAIPILTAVVPSWRPNAVAVSDPVTGGYVSANPNLLQNLTALLHMPTAQASPHVAPITAADTLGVKAETSHSPWRMPDLRLWVSGIWLAGVAAMLVPIALGALSVWRLGRRRHVVSDQSWLHLLNAVRGQMGITRDVTLFRSGERDMPMTWGILHPKVLVPASSDEWSMKRRRVVLMHELAHIQRHDCLSHVLSQFARAVHWFNPLCWLAARQLTVERELACDDLVLRCGTLPSDYAEQLLAVAAGSRQWWSFPIAAVAMARPSKLRERLVAILDPQRRRSAVSRTEAGALIALLMLFLTPMSMFNLVVAGAAQVAGGGPPGVAAEMAGDMPPLTAGTHFLIRVDLKKVSPDQLASTAKAIIGDQAGLFDDAIARYRPVYNAMSGNDATTVWISAAIDASPNPAGPSNQTIYIRVASDDRSKSLQADLSKAMGAPGRDETFVRDGQFLVLRERSVPPTRNEAVNGHGAAQPPEVEKAPVADAPTVKAFAQALSAANADDGVVLALVPDAAMKAALEKAPADLPFPVKLLVETLHAAESITVGTNPGNTPSLSVRVQCADDVATKFVSGNLDESMVAMADQLNEMSKKADGSASPEHAGSARSLTPLIDQLKRTKTVIQGHVVGLSLDSKQLASLGTGAAPLLVGARHNAADVQSMNNMRQLVLGMLMYADAHNGQWPAKLDDIADSVGGAAGLKRIMTSPITHDPAGYIYQKPDGKVADVKEPSKTAILFESENGKKNESGIIGYADGHVQRAGK